MARVRFLVGAVLKTVNAVEAEDLFERLVAGTLGNREIAALFSMGEVRALADGFLAGALKAEVASGRLAGAQARTTIRRWITFCNRQRPQTANGSQPPTLVYFNPFEQAQVEAQISQKPVQKRGGAQCGRESVGFSFLPERTSNRSRFISAIRSCSS
jgi:hypothetical protein